jgi:hypothetical protein
VKKIVLISDFSNTSEKIKKLHDLIIKIKNEGYEICLASHVSLPEIIIDHCDYYFYDKNNDISYDPYIKNWKKFSNEYFSIGYKSLCNISSHLPAILRLFCGSLTFLKSLGYEIVHYLEYDSIVENFYEIYDNENLLLNFSVVGYVDEVFENRVENPKWFLGHFFSLNLKDFNFEELIFDRDLIMNEMHKNSLSESSYFEKTTYNLFFSSKNKYSKKASEIEKSISSCWSDSQDSVYNIENSISFITENNILRVFVDNVINERDVKIQLILDDLKFETFKVNANRWSIFNLSYYPEERIAIIIDDQTKKILDLKSSDLFYIKSFNFNLK